MEYIHDEYSQVSPDDFPEKAAKKHGWNSVTKGNVSDQRKRWRKKNRSKYNEYMRRYMAHKRTRPHLTNDQV